MAKRVFIAIAVVVATAGWPSAAQSRPKTCSLPKAAKVSRVTPSMIVYRLPNTTTASPGYPAISVSYRLMACLRPTNKRRLLDPEIGAHLGGAGSQTTLTALSVGGPFVAFLTELDDSYDSHYLSVTVLDLRNGDQLRTGVSGEGSRSAGGLKLSPDGRVVLVVSNLNPYRLTGPTEVGLWSIQARKFKLLEAGAGPFVASFTPGGVQWTSPNGQQDALLQAVFVRP